MSQVELTTLGESCEFFNGKAHEKDIDIDGKYIVVNSKFISQEGKVLKRTKEQMFPLFKGDIVMVMSDVPNGKALAKCAIIDEDETYSLNQRICCIRSKEFDTKYLYYQLNRNEHFLAFNNGENQTNLRKGDILACPLLKPSLEEQKRIVADLESALFALDHATANAEKNLQNTKELFDSFLHGVFENKNGEKKEIKLGDVCQIINGGTPKSKVKEYWDGHIKWITPADLGKLKTVLVSDTPRKITDLGLQKSSAKLFPEYSVILSTRAPIGHLAINTVPMSTNQGCRGIVPNENLETWYLYYFLKGNIELLNELGTGTTFLELSTKTLSSVKIPLPPLAEQQSIIGNLNILREETKKLENLYLSKITNIEEIRKRILQKAFQVEIKAEKELAV